MSESAAFTLRQRAEKLSARLPPLLVEAQRVASTVAQGVHGRRRVGQGETFWQFRPYDMGDQPQSIDWRQTAKRDRVFVREMEWEAAQSTWLWRDTSASMSWRSSKKFPDKRGRADLLTLALADLLIRGGEHVALLETGDRPASSRAVLSRLAHQIELAGTSDNSLPPIRPLPRHGQVVFIGDFLDPLPEIEQVVRGYASAGVKGHILQILDPAEEALPYQGRVRFEGLEGETPWLLAKVEKVRPDYVARLTRQRDGLRNLTRSLGWGYDFHRCDQPAQNALLALFSALSHSVTG
ncbi:MAG: DUF58 domain-containing protein [Pseudomonadota bacterium]